MVDKKKQTLASLKNKAKMVGIDVDELLAEIKAEIGAEILGAIKPELVGIIKTELAGASGGQVDIEQLAYKVAELLKPSLAAMTTEDLKKEVEARLVDMLLKEIEKIKAKLVEGLKNNQEELKTIKDMLPSLVDKRYKSFREEVAKDLREMNGAPADGQGGGTARGSIVNKLNNVSPDVLDKVLDKLADKLFGGQESSQAVRMMDRLEGVLKGISLKTGEAKIGDIAKAIGYES